jgi:hypothetical protein
MNLATIVFLGALSASGFQEAPPSSAPAPPPAAQAPDSSQPSTPAPQTAPERCQKSEGSVESKPADSTKPDTPPAECAKPKTGKAAGKKRPRKIVVREGGAAETQVQLSAGMPAEQASHQRQTTDQLLSSTEANLRRISNRPLQDEQKAMVTQIRRYIEEAQAAIKAGDVTRGRNLALKAHLLSDELVPRP